MLVKSLVVLCTLAASVFSYSAKALDRATPTGLEFCTVCHGSQLKGNPNIGAPRLSGLSKAYVERQLLNFKQGKRGVHSADDRGGEMRPMVSNLSDSEIANIATWVANTNSSKPIPTLQADASAGRALYTTCAACHGASGEGNDLLGAPKLTGLNDWYLATQLNHFRLNIRGNESTDMYGQQMKAASKVIRSEQDAANLAAYIIQLK